jgi:hypothetical protein
MAIFFEKILKKYYYKVFSKKHLVNIKKKGDQSMYNFKAVEKKWQNRWYDEKRHNGPITSVTYQYMMNRHWGLGATASLLYYNKKMVYSDTGETADKMSETALALMFTTRYYWRTKNWVRVYSSASVGFGYDWEKKYKTWKGNDSQKIIFCGQISPLGIEVGKYRLIGFGELGLGMTGWFRAGIGYRF